MSLFTRIEKLEKQTEGMIRDFSKCQCNGGKPVYECYVQSVGSVPMRNGKAFSETDPICRKCSKPQARDVMIIAGVKGTDGPAGSIPATFNIRTQPANESGENQ